MAHGSVLILNYDHSRFIHSGGRQRSLQTCRSAQWAGWLWRSFLGACSAPERVQAGGTYNIGCRARLGRGWRPTALAPVTAPLPGTYAIARTRRIPGFGRGSSRSNTSDWIARRMPNCGRLKVDPLPNVNVGYGSQVVEEALDTPDDRRTRRARRACR